MHISQYTSFTEKQYKSSYNFSNNNQTKKASLLRDVFKTTHLIKSSMLLIMQGR